MNGSLNANNAAAGSSSESVVFNTAQGSKNPEAGSWVVDQSSIGTKGMFDSGNDKSPVAKGSPDPRS